MNIKEFELGSIITRNEPCTYAHNGVKDGSWLGDKIILQGYDPVAKMFFIEHAEGIFKDDITKMSFARDAWDEGWCEYPKNAPGKFGGKRVVKKNFLQRFFEKIIWTPKIK